MPQGNMILEDNLPKYLKDRYTVLWMYYDLFGVENEIDI